MLSGNIDIYAKRQKTVEDWCLADFMEINNIKYVKKHERQTKGYGYC